MGWFCWKILLEKRNLETGITSARFWNFFHIFQKNLSNSE